MSDDMNSKRKAYEDTHAKLKMAIFEAVRAQTVNRYKLEEALKKYFDKQQEYLGWMHDRIVELSKTHK